VRRTTSHDSFRPEGLSGPVEVVALGRDLRTGADGEPSVLGSARLDLGVEYLPNRTVTRITADPPHPGVGKLVGVSASAGFRQAVDEAMPGERVSRSVRFQLLDDLPTALLVSGYALQAGAAKIRRKGPMLQHPDMCAGWVSGGTMLSGMSEEGRPPPHRGPVAPVVEAGDDPLGWHQMDVLPVHGMRRRRRLDVWLEDGVGQVECFFRDSHVDVEGVETVLHEYTVHATVDPSTSRFASCEADVGALPWPECPNAAASAGRLGGAPVEGLRRWVRDTFVGISTCTHLNDTLRSLEDVGALLTAVPESRGAGTS
jgi:hypothetical protein